MKVISSIFVVSMLFSMLYGQWPGEIQVTNTPVIERMYPNNWSIATGTNPSTHEAMVHIVWQKQITYYRYEVYYVQILGLMSLRPLTNNPDGAAFHPSIAVSGATVHVAYTVATAYPGWGNIYYIRSTNGGTTWSTPYPICTSGYAEYPSIAVSGNVVHIAWGDNPDAGGYNWEVYYQRSTDNGASWTERVQRLTNITYSGREAKMPCVAVSNNYVHVVWNSDSIGSQFAWEVYYKHSTDYGASWNASTVRISDDNPYESRQPSVATRGNNVYVAWTDVRSAGSNAEVYFDCSYDNGNSWQYAQDNLLSTDDLNPSQHPCVAVNHDFVFIVYQDTKNTSNPVHAELWCTRSDDLGNNWTEEQVTVNNGKDSQTPAIATYESTAHVAWDEQQTMYTNFDIYYNKKTYISPLYSTGSLGFPLNAQQLSANAIHLTGQLPDAGPVTITLFNSLGQLVNKTMHVPAGKSISFIWQINDIPKGVYFLRMSQSSGWQKSTSIVIAR